MSDLILGVGLVLAIEGFLYAAFPGGVKQMMQRALPLPETSLRTFGLAALALGVVMVWLVRG